MTTAENAATPITELHGYGLTFHQTRPLQQAGITTVEQLTELVDEHDDAPEGSRLAGVPSFGPARVQKVLDAVHTWRERG
jgi:hypothetical protein